ncbi:SPANXN3 isoform 1 [Pongo abelii]|uniref:SPANXN3 isoform 1 n=1 Tax=Pongo abelii TaxID=9601 RepID=A0A2J8XTN7_PONAB|nr:SPANXN3 isoform 1 [Pongo abelii]
MDDKHPSTSGEKRKSPCDTNYDNEQIRLNVKKIYSTQLENDQSREDTINPVQEEEERIREVVETPAKESEDPSVQAEDP